MNHYKECSKCHHLAEDCRCAGKSANREKAEEIAEKLETYLPVRWQQQLFEDEIEKALDEKDKEIERLGDLCSDYKESGKQDKLKWMELEKRYQAAWKVALFLGESYFYDYYAFDTEQAKYAVEEEIEKRLKERM